MARGRKLKGPIEVLSETGVTVIEKSFLPTPIPSAIPLPECASVVTTEPVVSTAVSVEPTAGPPALLAHSPLGGSSTERWVNCSGSVALTASLRQSDWYKAQEPEDYTKDGTEAHRLAAWCLNTGSEGWEAPAEQFPNLTSEMLDAVEVYVNYCRSRPGDWLIEHFMHRPDIHALFYGTLDFCAISRLDDFLEIVDYKHGVGVCVEPHLNYQFMYYAYGKIGEDRENYPDSTRIRLTVAQPRYPHPEGPIRSWDTDAGRIRIWARETLLPAMDRTVKDKFLSVGEWCRFCPAKLVCPAMRHLTFEIASTSDMAVSQLDDDVLGSLYAKWQRAKMLGKALEQEAYRRMFEGGTVPGCKLVAGKANRTWRDGAERELDERFKLDAFVPPAYKSPAQIEKLPGGKDFVAQYAYTPEAGLTVALADDRRTAVTIKSGAERFGSYENVVNEAAE